PKDMVLAPGAQQWTTADQLRHLSGNFGPPATVRPARRLVRGVAAALWAGASWLKASRRRWVPAVCLLGGLLAVTGLVAWTARRGNQAGLRGDTTAAITAAAQPNAPEGAESPSQAATGGNADRHGALAQGKLSGEQIYSKALRSTVWISNPGMGFG